MKRTGLKSAYELFQRYKPVIFKIQSQQLSPVNIFNIMDKINLKEKFSLFSEYWSPKIVGELNGQLVKLAKFKGEFIWHHHEHEDELFLVVEGTLNMAFRDKTITVNKGEFIIVPKGTEHKPIAAEEVLVMLFEPAATINTGNTNNGLTKTTLDKI